MTPFLSVIIPAYNEQENLEQCVQVLQDQLTRLPDGFEIVIVNDCSRDGTAESGEVLTRKWPNVRIFHHTRNIGIGGAFRTGISQARGEWVLLFPADLALEPDNVWRYIEAAPQADVVVGLRSDRRDYSFFRKIVSWSNIRLIQLLFGMQEKQYQYISMYRREVLNEIHIDYWRSAFFLAEIIIKAKDAGKRLVQVNIRYAPRRKGQPTGARLTLILKTLGDMFHFWLRRSGQNAHRNGQNSPRRPRSVTYLALGVLTIAGFYSLRLLFALYRWQTLQSYFNIQPAYLAVTGLMWAICFWTAGLGLWWGRSQAPRWTRIITIGYSLYYWSELIGLSMRQSIHFSVPVQAPFSAVVNLVGIGVTFWILSTKKTRVFFGDLHERSRKN